MFKALIHRQNHHTPRATKLSFHQDAGEIRLGTWCIAFIPGEDFLHAARQLHLGFLFFAQRANAPIAQPAFPVTGALCRLILWRHCGEKRRNAPLIIPPARIKRAQVQRFRPYAQNLGPRFPGGAQHAGR